MIKSISFWEKEALSKCYDAIIIGAGFVGLSAAIHYKTIHPNKDVLVLERGVIAYGASTRNAGFSCFGSIGELEDDLSNASLESVKETVFMRFAGLQKLKSLVPKGEMDYWTSGSVELFENKEDFERANQRIDFWNDQLNELVGDAIFEKVTVNNGAFYKYGISNPYEGQLNPKKALNYLEYLARKKGIDLFYGMQVEEWEKKEDEVIVNTKEGLKYHGKCIILATNAFTKQLVKDLDVNPVRNQVLITEEIEDLQWKGCFHLDKGYIYFRNVGKRILLGGARNISDHEAVDAYGNTKELQDYLEKYLKTRILDREDVKIDHWWSGILGIGTEKMPIIRKFAPRTYVAVRLGGMGVAIGTLVGEKIAQLVATNEE